MNSEEKPKYQRPVKRIAELHPGDKGFNITVDIKEKEDVRTVQIKSTGEQKSVANATVKDDTGEISMTLWGKDAENLKQGQTILIENGLVGDWQNKLELTAGKFGKITLLSKKE